MSDVAGDLTSTPSPPKSRGKETIHVHRKIKRHVEEESHGTWKIAYADFVTALMAFFVLMWLLSVVGAHERQHEAEFFNPYASEESETSRPQGGVIAIFDGGMMGGSSVERPLPEDEAGKVDKQEELEEELQLKRRLTPKIDDIAAWRDQIQRFEQETRELRQVRDRIHHVLQQIDILRDLAENVVIEEVPEGLRIQIIDRDGFSMFSSGSAEMTRRAQILLAAIGTILDELPNKIAISGHTDSVPYTGRTNYGNWELSADRANAARRLLVSNGMSSTQIARVEGLADTRHFVADAPRDPRNRRISLLVLREYLISPDVKDVIDNWLAVRNSR